MCACWHAQTKRCQNIGVVGAEKWPYSFEQQPEFFKCSMLTLTLPVYPSAASQHTPQQVSSCQARMGHGSVAPIHVWHDRRPGFNDGVVGMYMHPLVFHRFPQTLDVHMIPLNNGDMDRLQRHYQFSLLAKHRKMDESMSLLFETF